MQTASYLECSRWNHSKPLHICVSSAHQFWKEQTQRHNFILKYKLNFVKPIFHISSSGSDKIYSKHLNLTKYTLLLPLSLILLLLYLSPHCFNIFHWIFSVFFIVCNVKKIYIKVYCQCKSFVNVKLLQCLCECVCVCVGENKNFKA